MHSLRGKRGLIGGLMFALAAAVALPSVAHAGPDPEAQRSNTGRYRLFAGNLGAITINRIYYGLNSRGEVGVDSLNSSTIGGGFWPKGTGNQYMFNSGLQVAGIIQGAKPNNPWAGDTTGGMFFDASGLRQHGTSVTELYNATNPTDVANWPQAAYVPQGDLSEELFDPLLRGRVTASQGDVWWISSEADPGLNAARPHPLGIIAEYRVMGWNFPSGNEDLVYLVITLYNITTLDQSAYAQYRPGLREILIEQAQQFHALNNSTFTVDLPDEGYTIDPFYVAFAADPDVTNSAGVNFSSVNLPFAMGYAYHADFPRAAGWTFSPNIFGPPFFPGSGFVGMKYLKSATGPGKINLFSNTTNGGAFSDPNSAVRLFKYMSGDVTPADGVSCNQGDVQVTRICYIQDASPADIRLMESSTAVTLEAGQSASIVVSYIHAAPVQLPGYVGGTRVLPGDPVRLSNATLLQQGANRIDSMMGFAGYEDDNADDIVQQNETRAVPGSLLGKALTAQTIFDNKFLLPFAPEAPDFFLIPGNGQVTVVWRPSGSEAEGDPYFQVASQASAVPPGGGAPVPNALYDANYRNFDVEGYRIYRGRSDTPTGLSLIAQYDYAGTTFSDYTGQVADPARGSKCAPELGVTSSCAGVFDAQTPGVQLTKKVEYDLSGNLVQVRKGDRTLLASGDVINLTADTAVVGGGTGFPGLDDTGIPFAFVDQAPRNGINYFYAVTAFDVNSISSTGAGNTSLESARITKRVQPRTSAGNYANEATVQTGVFGRNGLLTDNVIPTLDPATGKFSKGFPPSDAVSLSLAAFVKEVLTEPGEVSLSVDSISVVAYAGASTHDAVYHYTISAQAGIIHLDVPVHLSSTSGTASAAGAFDAITADPALTQKYGAPAGDFGIGGSFSVRYGGGYYYGVKSRGCVNGVSGFTSFPLCDANGPRWFMGTDNGTMMDNPNAANTAAFRTGTARTDFNNVGGPLDGVTTIFRPMAYNDYSSSFRDVEAVLSPFMSAADYRVYWGEGGHVDSVIDVTHDVPVPFRADKLDATWGILNQSATQNGATYYDQRSELTVTDLGCFDPIKALNPAGIRCTGNSPLLSETAVPGPIAYGSASSTSIDRTAPTAAGQGFVFYLKGQPFMFELAGGVPAAGTVWTMRDYIGVISGGIQAAGDGGPMSFSTQNMPRSFSAIGASVKFAFDLTNAVGASTSETLAKVHTVPDPYYVTSSFEATTTSKIIKFVNLPEVATIRIYTASGVLVRVLQHASTAFGGETDWDVRNRNNQFVASGVYFYHVTAENGETTVGRMTIINYAQ
jgi:hypothetical protein